MTIGHGKIVLFGEHAAVYGQPAVVAGLKLGTHIRLQTNEQAELRIRLASGETPSPLVEQAVRAMIRSLPHQTDHLTLNIQNDLPHGVGLGGSAALSVAVARALLGAEPADDVVARLAQRGEQVFHGISSGMDVAAALHSHLIRFQLGRAQPLPLARPLRLLIARVSAAPPTRSLVAQVARAHSGKTQDLIDDMGSLAQRGAEALSHGNLPRLGELMNRNHALLCALGVSTPELDRCCEQARELGAWGAKLTGAGGGGCVLILAPGRENALRDRLVRDGIEEVLAVEIEEREQNHE